MTITEQRKSELVELARTIKFLWKGRLARVAGFKNNYATVTTSLPGFWGCSWEAVERVLSGQSTFDQENLWLVSRAWLGSE